MEFLVFGGLKKIFYSVQISIYAKVKIGNFLIFVFLFLEYLWRKMVLPLKWHGCKNSIKSSEGSGNSIYRTLVSDRWITSQSSFISPHYLCLWLSRSLAMAPIAVGDKIPDGTLAHFDEQDQLQQVSIHSLAAGKKVILFGVPGAFTPVCR